MSKPARLHPKKETVKVNAKMIFMGSIATAIIMAWIGLSTATAIL